MAKKIRIKQVRSAIGQLKAKKLTLKALGIGKIGSTAVHDDVPSIRGMITSVSHLITVDSFEGDTQ